MKNLAILMVWLTMVFSFFEGGCSWFMWQKVPKRDASVENVECGLAPPIVDSVITAASVAGLGVFYGLSAGAPECVGLCGFDSGNFYAWIGTGFTLIAAVWAIASTTGWVNYHQCQEYQARVAVTKALHTGPELFTPSPHGGGSL